LIYEPARAQQSAVQDLFTDYERVLHIEGVSPVHNVSDQPFLHQYIAGIDTLANHPWSNLYAPADAFYNRGDFTVSLYDPEMAVYWRNLEPGGINNGAAWEGRGFSSSFSSISETSRHR